VDGVCRNRYYDYYTGRWLTHDPLGITPNPPMPNVFDAIGQYKDGLSLYQYVKSNPLVNSDSMGLILVPIKPTPKRCCKIKAFYSGPYWAGTTCTQDTIYRYSECSPELACCAAYKDNKNVTVYEAAEGECCWCSVYTVTESWVYLIPFHKSLSVRCEQGRGEWSAEVNGGTGKEWAKGKWVPVLVHHEASTGKYAYRGRTSCDAADKWKAKLTGMMWWYNYFHDCWTFAREYSRAIASTCP